MTFSNPAGDASNNAADYVTALLELLGDRDPLAEQAKLLAAITELVANMSTERLGRPEAPGKWSVLDVVRHLAHTELVYAYRYRVTVAHDRPDIPGFDQTLWSDRLSDDGADINSLLNRLAMVRTWNIDFLRSVRQEDRSREGHHEERGWESLDHQVRLGAAHDLVHRRQIERIKNAVG